MAEMSVDSKYWIENKSCIIYNCNENGTKQHYQSFQLPFQSILGCNKTWIHGMCKHLFHINHQITLLMATE